VQVPQVPHQGHLCWVRRNAQSQQPRTPSAKPPGLPSALLAIVKTSRAHPGDAEFGTDNILRRSRNAPGNCQMLTLSLISVGERLIPRPVCRVDVERYPVSEKTLVRHYVLRSRNAGEPIAAL
jgi:hypothetical protein